MSSSRGKRPTTACKLLALLSVIPALLASQQAADRITPAPTLDRIVIDVAAVTQTSAARSVSDVLVSRVPGLLVIQGSGLNGSGASVRFAGARSLILDQPPLILLDGFRIDAREDDSQLPLGGPGPSRLDDIPIEDVYSIEVLRGPATTAMYGPGAAAGVILIHTKQGSSGAARFGAFAQAAVHTVPTRWPANYGGVDADNANTFFQQGYCNLSAQAAGQCAQDYVQSFNPLVDRNPFTSAPHRQLGLNATGGPAWGAFRLAGTLDADAVAYSVPAVTWSDDYSNWDLRGSAALHPMHNVEVVGRIARGSSRLRLPMYQPVRSALMGTSDSTGFTWAPFFGDPGTQKLDRTQVGLDIHARPLAWLGVQALLGRDDAEYHELRRIPSQVRTWGQRTGAEHTLALNATASDIAWQGMRFTTSLGVERLVHHDKAQVEQIQPDTITTCDMNTPVLCSYMSRVRNERRNVTGLYGVERIGFGRVFVTGAVRHDSYDARAWSATHPSVAVDVVAKSSRPGSEQRRALEQLAFRAAYGVADQPLPFLFETFVVGPFPAPAPLKPERTREFALSAEAGGAAGRWRAQASVYDLRSNALQYVLVSGPVGFSSGYVPGAVLANRGVAAMVSANLIDRSSWGWDLVLSVWGNRNRLVKQTSGPAFYSDGVNITGQAEFKGYPANGYWGFPIVSFTDNNGDGIIGSGEVVTSPTLAWIGTPYPTQGAALTSSVRFARRFRLSATFDYRAGQTLFNETANLRCLYALCRGRVDPATPLAEQAVALAAYSLPPQYFEDADYLKVRELTLTFDVPDRLAAALGARVATVMIGGRDLMTWTKYSGADPEAGSYARHPGTPAIVGDDATVPIPASWTLRLRVSY